MKQKLEEITNLTYEWYKLIGSDHHKDRDCHWYVETRWSYGYKPDYVVRHHGYILDEIEEICSTYEEALERLKQILQKSIEAEKQNEDEYDD